MAALALACCGGPRQIEVDHGWVRLPPVQGHPAAAYFEIHGGSVDETLIAVDSPVALHAAMHESMSSNGMESMAPLKQVAVPAGKTVKFVPGGKHVMLFGLNPAVKPGGTVGLRFVFADGKEMTYQAKAIAASAPDPEN
jgi:copper(I)-binding protein